MARAWREWITELLDVALRVPPLFVMDAVLNNYFINITHQDNQDVTTDGPQSLIVLIIYSLAPVFLSVLVFIAALTAFVLTTAFLLNVYCTIFIISLVGVSYHWNQEFVYEQMNTVLSGVGVSGEDEVVALLVLRGSSISVNVLTQVTLAYVFIFFTDHVLPRSIIVFSFLLPTICSCFIMETDFSVYSPLIATIVPTLQLLMLLVMNAGRLQNKARLTITWLKMVIQNYGLHMFVENQWQRLHVPEVLRCFFLCRVLEQATYLLSDALYTHYTQQEAEVGADLHPIFSLTLLTAHQLLDVARTLTVRGCETLVALLGMTGWLSTASHHLVHMVQLFLQNEDDDDRSISSVSAILFFILAVQTGLTNMPPNLRLDRLYKNVCLLFTAILHFIHTMVNPILMALSASHNRSIGKHVRALTVCVMLIIMPAVFVYYLWQYNNLTTWLFAVSAFCVEVIIKVLITLMLYVLFLVDAYRNTFWEELDDYVHYIKTVGTSIEFMFGIILFCNGLFIMCFESGGTVRAIMMCIHAYFNIYLQAKEGWKIFIKRRTAVNKINTLREASPEELAAHNDVCAICYQELKTAKMTKCKHYYHPLCLRKWLYVQDNCPLCQEVLYNKEEDEENTQGTL